MWAAVDGRIIPMPINRTTIQALHGVELHDDEDTAAYLASLAEPRAELKNSEDAVVAKVGRDLYERLFRGYTRKQWSLDPSELHASVCARLPVRTNEDDRYFGDSFQNMPAAGFTAMFERMLDHPNIELALGTEYDDIRDEVDARQLVWTGPIDEFFGYRLGTLPYRSLQFERETRATPGGRLVQPVAVINYPNERIPYTRVTEFRHLTGQVSDFSTLTYEYPTAEGDPYYPIPRPENRELYHRYEALAAERPGRDVRRAAGSLPVPEHGSGGGPGARCRGSLGGRARLRAGPARGRVSAPDVIVAWLQNDYGKLGRAGEAIAHSLVRSSSGRPRRLRRAVPARPGRAPARCPRRSRAARVQRQRHARRPAPTRSRAGSSDSPS